MQSPAVVLWLPAAHGAQLPAEAPMHPLRYWPAAQGAARSEVGGDSITKALFSFLGKGMQSLHSKGHS